MSARAPYRRRAMRRPGSVFEITERDLDLLALVGLAGYLSTAQIAREFFPSIDRCRRRLRQLFDGRLITVTLASSTKPNLISLARPGLSLVLRQRPELNGRVYLAGAIRLAGVEHHLAVVDARLYAAALSALRGVPLVQWSNGGGALVRELGFSEWHLSPDGVALFANSLVVAVEVDCNTEPRSTIASKLDRYAGAFNARRLDALWFVVRGSSDRRESVVKLVSERGLASAVRVIDHGLLVARPLVELGVLGGTTRPKEGRAP